MDMPDMDVLLSAEEVAGLAVQDTTQAGNQFVTTVFNVHTGSINRYWTSMAKSSGNQMFNDDFTRIELVCNQETLDAIHFFHGMAT